MVFHRLRFLSLACAATLLVACASDVSSDDEDTDLDAVGADTETGREIDAGDQDAGVDVTADVPGDGGTDTVEPPAECGDGAVDPGEQCDDGVDNSDTAPDACRTDCDEAACGDGVVDSGEECDDGNRVDDDQCSLACRRPVTDVCRPCRDNSVCGEELDACVQLDDGDFCGLNCRADRDCPDGFVCADVRSLDDAPVRQCVPSSGACAGCFDPDRDGFGTGEECEGAGDCDQGSADTYPGAAELCDGLDNDCDGEVDEDLGGSTFYPDRDRDGYGDDAGGVSSCAKPVGFVDRGGDCDDDDPRSYDGAPELCDGVDNDCDDTIDNDTAAADFWPDTDGDGYGDRDASPTNTCEPTDGFVVNDDDCDDGNGLVRPGADEVCDDGLDGDCDGAVDCDDSDCAGSPACGDMLCVDDGFENNDTRATASPVGAGSFANLVACQGDDDLYAVSLAAGDELTITATFAHADGDIDISLLDADGRTVAASTGVTDNEEIAITIGTAGTYLVRVRLFSDSGAPGNGYVLDIAIDSAVPTCRDDAYEDNDTRDTATGARPGAIADLTVCPGDSDYFAIDLTAEDELTVSADFVDAAGDIDVRIFNGAGTVVASGVTLTDDETVAYTVTRSGRYVIEVTLFADDDTPGNAYDLDIDVVSAGPACDSDAFENNDTRATASPIAAGTYADLIVCGEDEDYYAVELGVGDRISVSVSFGFFDGNIDLGLINPAGSLVAESAGLFATTESLSYTARSSGSFVINVYQAFDLLGESTDYQMSVTIVRAAPTCADDVFEDNDTAASASALAAGSFGDLSACPGDDDFYRVSLGAGDTITASLDFADAAGDLDLRLLNAAGSVVASSVSTTDDETLTYVAPAAGTFTLRVNLYADAGDPGNAYSLDVAVVVAPSVCPSDRLENNDDLEGAEPLPPELYTGLFVCEDDEDWYRVVLGAGDTISVLLSFTHADGDVDLQLLDSAGAVLTGSASTSDDESVEYTVSAAGTYYIRVLLYLDAGDEGAEYDILVDVESPVTGCVDDDLEDNDTIDTASVTGGGEIDGLRVCDADNDYFTTFMIAGEIIQVDATFTHAEGDVDMTLLDEDGAVVARSVSVSDNESLTYTAEYDGLYTLRVYLLRDLGSVDGNSYALDITFDTPALTCEDDDRYEDNDDATDATYVLPGIYEELIACEGDSDFYEMLLFAGELLVIDVLFTHDEGDIDIVLYDDALDIVEEADSEDDDEELVIEITETGFYTLEVELFEDLGDTDGNPYALIIDAF